MTAVAAGVSLLSWQAPDVGSRAAAGLQECNQARISERCMTMRRKGNVIGRRVQEEPWRWRAKPRPHLLRRPLSSTVSYQEATIPRYLTALLPPGKML